MNISVDVIPDLYDKLSNALTPVLGYTQLLLQELPEKRPYRKDMQKILSGVRRLKKVTDLLIELSNNKNEHTFQLTNINNLIKEALNTIGDDGLTNNFNIIKKHQGTFKVQSKEDRTTYIIRLPVNDCEGRETTESGSMPLVKEVCDG